VSAILFASDIDDPAPWRAAIAERFPELEFRVFPELGRIDDIEYALVWKIAGGVLARLPQLRAIFALGAGVDQILIDPLFPRHLPLARLVEAGLAEQMSEYAILGTLYFHRHMAEYLAQQRRREWRMLPGRHPAERKVGVMGLGILGGDAVRKLATIGFATAGWSRTRKTLPGIECFAGDGELPAFLARTEILINLLPLTAATRGILAAPLFDRLPDGAAILHMGRGAQLLPEDLLAALDRGKLAGAMLDVFPEEPLPQQSPLWEHPKIVVTPHVSTQPIAELAMRQVVDNIGRSRRGERLIGLVDPAAGY
jgi:glyoxylate/hydroxypyruvate reductase A